MATQGRKSLAEQQRHRTRAKNAVAPRISELKEPYQPLRKQQPNRQVGQKNQAYQQELNKNDDGRLQPMAIALARGPTVIVHHM